MLLSVDPEFTVFKGSFFASMQTIIWTNEHLASGFHPSQQFVVFIFYLLFSCHIKTTTEGSEEKKKKSQKEHCRGSRACRFPCGYKSKALPELQGGMEGVKSHFCISDLKILNKKSQILLFWKQLTELECIFSVDFVQGGCCQDRARTSWIPTQDPIRLHRQHRKIQGHFSSWDTSKRYQNQDVLIQMFPEPAQSVVLFCRHICRSEKLEEETAVLGYWSILRYWG